MKTTLTTDEEDLRRRLEALERDHPPNMRGIAPVPAPQLPTSGWKYEKRLADDRKRAEQQAAALAEQQRLAAERRAADEEAERVWIANGPVREKALSEIPAAEAARDILAGELYEVEQQLTELRRLASE